MKIRFLTKADFFMLWEFAQANLDCLDVVKATIGEHLASGV